MKELDIDLLIIDVDDTFIPTEEACFIIENAVAQSMGFAPMTRETHQRNWGVHLEEALLERFPGIDRKAFIERVALVLPGYVERGEIDQIPQENLDTLDVLIDRGKRLAILTSRTLDEARHLVDPKHHLNSRVEKFYHRDNSLFYKPDPRAFHQPLIDFGIDPSRAAYAGDTLNDGRASTGAGLQFIASLESGLKTEENFSSIKVAAFINKFTDLRHVIK